MMQPTESHAREDATGGLRRSSPSRRSPPQSEMCPVFVVVAHLFREQSLQMTLVHGDDVIQQVPPAACNPAFRHTILPGAFERGPQRLHVEGSNRCGNLKPVLPVSVEDQKPGSRPKRKGFPQLLNRPQAGIWLYHCHISDHMLAGMMTRYEVKPR